MAAVFPPTLHPAHMQVAVAGKENVFVRAWHASGVVGLVLVVLGVCTMGFTLYGTQRTTAQILTNQPAAVQNPEKGLKYGGMAALAGGGILAFHGLVMFVGQKLHHS